MTIIIGVLGVIQCNRTWIRRVSRKHAYTDQACASKCRLETSTVAFKRLQPSLGFILTYPKNSNDIQKNCLSSFSLLVLPVCIPFLDDPFMLILNRCPTLQGYNILHVPLTVASGTEAQGRVQSGLGKGTKRIASTCESLQLPVLQCFLWDVSVAKVYRILLCTLWESNRAMEKHHR